MPFNCQVACYYCNITPPSSYYNNSYDFWVLYNNSGFFQLYSWCLKNSYQVLQGFIIFKITISFPRIICILTIFITYIFCLDTNYKEINHTFNLFQYIQMEHRLSFLNMMDLNTTDHTNSHHIIATTRLILHMCQYKINFSFISSYLIKSVESILWLIKLFQIPFKCFEVTVNSLETTWIIARYSCYIFMYDAHIKCV